MIEVRRDFESRLEEIKGYLSYLERLEEPGACIYRPHKATHKYLTVDQDVFKTLKGSAFLLIYNNVEATVRDSFMYLYNEIVSNNISYNDTTSQFRDIWLNRRFMDLLDPNSNWNSYKKKTESLINEVLNNEALDLDRKAIGISGNIDAEIIRDVFKSHAAKFRAHKSAKGGKELGLVKDKRNSLAHGSISFSECGREYNLADLKRINKETATFLKGVISSMDRFVTRRGYER